MTSVFQGLSLSRSMGAGRREPWERGWSKNPLLAQTLPIMQLRISTPTTPLKAALMLHHLTILPNPVDKKVDTQDETVGIIKESILQRYEIAKETPISQRPPIPKIKNERHAKSAIETANKAILSRQPDLSQTSTILCMNLPYC